MSRTRACEHSLKSTTASLAVMQASSAYVARVAGRISIGTGKYCAPLVSPRYTKYDAFGRGDGDGRIWVRRTQEVQQ